MTEYDDRLDAYRRARKIADEARQAWDAFLATTPLEGGQLTRPASANVRTAFDALAAAEEEEATARARLLLFIQPTD
jgi:hypothetical protein